MSFIDAFIMFTLIGKKIVKVKHFEFWFNKFLTYAFGTQVCMSNASLMEVSQKDSLVTPNGNCKKAIGLCNKSCLLLCCQNLCAQQHPGGTGTCEVPIGTTATCFCNYPCN